MEQISKYQAILEDQYYDFGNINNYKLAINKIDEEEYEIIIGRNIDIYKITIDKTTILNGILKEYPSILYKFLIEQINEKCSLASFIELVNVNNKESIEINISLKTKYFFEKVNLILNKLTDDYFQKQINETKLKTYVLEKYDNISDEDINIYTHVLNGNKYDQQSEDYKKKFQYIKHNVTFKNYNYPLLGIYYGRNRTKENFEIKYNECQIYISGDISLKLFENREELYKYNNKIFGSYTNTTNNYIIKFKLPINYNKVIVKNYHTRNYTNNLYSIIIDSDLLIIFGQISEYTLDNLIFI